MAKTAVVILNWNGKEFLSKFLPPLVQHTTSPNVELIVADNGSTDESISYIKENFPTIVLICLDKNYGFAEGYNLALNKLDCDYYVLLNSDVEVSDGWLKPMLELIESDDKIAACQPKIKDYNNKGDFEYAGAAGGFLDKHGYPFCQGRLFNIIEKDEGQYNNTRDIFWASGACFVIKAELYHKAGGLDKDFFAHMEEIDLCWRIKKYGV